MMEVTNRHFRYMLRLLTKRTELYTEIEYSVKCRIGVDELDSYEYLSNFIHTTSQSGVNNYIIHARKAMLKLDTKDNLKVPPINYEFATKLVSDFPHINFVINGEIKLLQDVKYFLDRGVR